MGAVVSTPQSRDAPVLARVCTPGLGGVVSTRVCTPGLGVVATRVRTQGLDGVDSTESPIRVLSGSMSAAPTRRPRTLRK